jgi:IS1 family transposase
VWVPHQAPIGLKASDVSLSNQTSAPEVHCPGKRHTQKIERKHLTLRTRMKRLVRKTICLLKPCHDLVYILGAFSRL